MHRYPTFITHKSANIFFNLFTFIFGMKADTSILCCCQLVYVVIQFSLPLLISQSGGLLKSRNLAKKVKLVKENLALDWQ